MDPELDRLLDEMWAAQDAVREHVATAVIAWRGNPPATPTVPTTAEWLDRYDVLRAARDQAESVWRNYVERRR